LLTKQGKLTLSQAFFSQHLAQVQKMQRQDQHQSKFTPVKTTQTTDVKQNYLKSLFGMIFA